MRVLFVATVVAVSCSAAAVEIVPARDIRAGMKGYGLSVFKGTEPERFGFEVIDVVRNIYPGQDMVLCRIEHPIVEKAGIIAGMSGSPLFVVEEGKPDRLMGALAYGWRFNKDPIAGITPAEQMKKGRGALTGGVPVPGEKDGGAAFRPLAAPLVISGTGPRCFEKASEFLRPFGFIPVQGGAEGEDGERLGRRLKPGDAVGVRLLSGDMDWTATGTVTWVERDEVYAFGHPFMLAGPVRLPMTAAKVHVIIPSVMSSFKLSSALETVGTLEMDRLSAIRGRLGAGPDMLPLKVVCGVKGGEEREFSYRVARLRTLAPGIAASALMDSLEKTLPFSGDCAVEVDMTVELKGGKKFHVKDRVVSTSGGEAAFSLYAVLQGVLDHPEERAEVESLSVRSVLEPGNFSAFIREVKAPARVVSGEEFTVEVLLRPFGNEPGDLVSVPVRLRAPLTSSPGSVVISAGPASSLHPPLPRPRSAEEYLEVLSRAGRQDVLRVVAGVKGVLGMTGEGRTLRMLPLSAAAALPGMDSTFDEGRAADVRTDYILQGGADVRVEVVPR